jgi:hypothetical protein
VPGQARHLTIGSSDRRSRLRWTKEGADDRDKVPSHAAGEAPRRSTSSLESALGGTLFDIWLATLLLGPLVLTGISGYLSWRRLAYPKLYILVGVLGLWGAAITVAVHVLSNIGVSGSVSPSVDDGSRPLGISMLIFLLAALFYLLALRYFMLKRESRAGAR